MKKFLVAILFSAFVALVLPLQTYLGNASAYAYGLGRLVAEQAAVALALAAAMLAALALWTRLFRSRRALPVLAASLLVAVAAMLYVESSVLAFGLPEINGELPDSLECMSRRIWDGAIWLVALSLAVVFRRAIAKRAAWILGAVLVLALASLFDAKSDEAAVESSRNGGYELSADIIDNVEYSPTRNVMLLVLDNVDARVATDIAAADPALAAKFPGFTAYRNNTGMHDSTKLGVPGIMTGKFFEPGPGALAKYIMSVFGPDSALEAYRDANAAIFAMFCTTSYGYTTAKIDPEKRRVKAEAKTPVVTSRTAEVPYLSLADAVLFRALPFAFKRQFLSTKLRQRDVIWNVDQKYDYEETVYPILAARPVAADPRAMFMKIHTHGAHGPYVPGITDARAATSNALVRLSELFDAYRARGVYDKSFVVVCADHGCGKYAASPEEPSKLMALLWIKPEGASQPFAATQVPTSHAKLAEILRASATKSLSAGECESILRTDPRFYRLRDPDDRHGSIDFDVDAAGKAVRRQPLAAR